MASAVTQSPFNTSTQAKEQKNPGLPYDRVGYFEQDEQERPLDADVVVAAVEEILGQPTPALPSIGFIKLDSNTLRSATKITNNVLNGTASLMFSDNGVKGAVEGIFDILTSREQTPEQIRAEQEAAAKKAGAIAQFRHNDQFASALRAPVQIKKAPQLIGDQPMSLEDVQKLLGNNQGYQGNVKHDGQLDTASKVAAESKSSDNQAMALKQRKDADMAALRSNSKSTGAGIVTAANQDGEKKGSTARTATG